VTGRRLRVALTGGIATGKSFCLRRFAQLGAPTIDADVLAREVVVPGSPGLAAVVAQFGPAVLQADGSLNRPALASIVFADPKRRAGLEAIIHPLVYAAIARWFEALPPPATLGIADIPLLFETGRAAEFDRVVVASCPPAIQLSRLMARDGLTMADARQRIGSQTPLVEKVRQADVVIETGGSVEETARRVDEVWSRILTA